MMNFNNQQPNNTPGLKQTTLNFNQQPMMQNTFNPQNQMNQQKPASFTGLNISPSKTFNLNTNPNFKPMTGLGQGNSMMGNNLQHNPSLGGAMGGGMNGGMTTGMGGTTMGMGGMTMGMGNTF